MPYNSRVPGDDHLPDDAAEPTLPIGESSDPELPERTHRGEAPGLRARLAAARVKIAVAVLLLVLGIAAWATGVGPGDGWGAEPDAAPSRVLAPGVPEAPEEDSSAAPGTSGTKTGLSYLGLCRAYQEEAATNPDAAGDPAFSALVEDAGSQAQVKKYCDELLGDASADATATPTSLPTAQPTTAPSGSTTPTRTPGPSSSPTLQPSPTPTATKPGPPTPTATATGPGGKPTKTPKR